jgi:hypothetical protein
MWYGQGKQQIEWWSATELWYRGRQTPLPIRWVLTRDLKGERDAQAYFSMEQQQSGLAIVIDFMKRWEASVTFEESRAYLGVETQRQWSDCAVERTTPCLLGFYSLVTLLGQKLYPRGDVLREQTAWYRKPQATFTDVLVAVRRHLWGDFWYSTLSENLMSFYSHARTSLALPMSRVPQLKICKVQVLSRQEYTDRPYAVTEATNQNFSRRPLELFSIQAQKRHRKLRPQQRLRLHRLQSQLLLRHQPRHL